MRCSAASARRLWKTNARYTTKRPALLAHVVGPIPSGAEAVLYTDTDWNIFDQSISLDQREDQAILETTPFAKKTKPEPEGSDGYRNSRADLRPTAKSSRQCSGTNQVRILRLITGWAERILDVLQSIEETVDGADDLKELDGRWMILFCDKLEAERFQRFDMAEIGARERTVSIPPCCATTVVDEKDEEEELELRWTRDHFDEEIATETFTARCASWRAPSLHRRRAHGLVC